MPAILDACVRKVMAKGHSESSAYAICRSSLGLQEDGSEDEKEPEEEMPDEEIDKRIENELARRLYADEPTLHKSVVVAKPIGEFKNGDDSGVLDATVFEEFVANFKRNPHVPVFLWDHVENLDEKVPDGWVEGLSINGAGELVADIKLHGEAAALVAGDRIRSASIAWTPQGKSYKGRGIGAVLQHVTLTNNPYIKDMPSIAAARAQGSEPLLVCFTALTMEAEMADNKQKQDELATLKDENKALREEVDALKAVPPDEQMAAKLKETESLLAFKLREVEDLKAQNTNLLDDVEKLKSPKVIEELTKKLKAQERQIKAATVRRLVAQGVSDGQFNLAMVGEPSEGWNHVSDEAVLSWYDKSVFQGDMATLKFALATYPKTTLNRRYPSGAPRGEVVLTKADEEAIKKMGLDPEKVRAQMEKDRQERD